MASARTVSVQTISPRWRSSRSPGVTSRAGLTRSPFNFTRPLSLAWVAKLRVLKKRAAHSHLSSRIRSSGDFSVGIDHARKYIGLRQRPHEPVERPPGLAAAPGQV